MLNLLGENFEGARWFRRAPSEAASCSTGNCSRAAAIHLRGDASERVRPHGIGVELL